VDAEVGPAGRHAVVVGVVGEAGEVGLVGEHAAALFDGEVEEAL